MVSWFRDNSLLLNAEKSTELIIKLGRTTQLNIDKIFVDGTEITPQETAKYLGVHFDNNFKFDIQSQILSKKCFRLSHYCVKLVRSFRSSTVETDFIDTFILSIILYPLTVMKSFLTKQDLKELIKVLRRLSRIAGKKADYFELVITERIEKSIKKLTAAIVTDENNPLFEKFRVRPNKSYRTRLNMILPRTQTHLAGKVLSYQYLKSKTTIS